MRIPLSRPAIGDREIEYVTRVLRSGQLSLGPVLGEFETRFARYLGAKYAIATNSGTSALHLCVKAFGIGPGDEVLTTSFSFAASTNCFLYEGAVPAFVDIDPRTLNIDPGEIRRTLERDYVAKRGCRPVNRRSGGTLKAILPVHVFGLPCAMGPILEIAREFNLLVLEDACEALGAEYFGRRVGTFGDAAVFAFYPNKQITTAEGGMIVTDDPETATLCRSLRNQGRNASATWLCHSHLGYNYRLSDLHCALGLAQLERIAELLTGRERIASMYSSALADIPELILCRDALGFKRSWFAYSIRLRGLLGPAIRNRLLARLQDRGIACQAYFPAIHRQPYFEKLSVELGRSLPHTEQASDCSLALPFFPSMTGDEVAEVCGAVREILAGREISATFQAPQAALDPARVAT